MRIVVDYDACEGNAVCASIAPEVFDVDEDEIVVVKAQPTEENAERVRRAVNSCPRAALSLGG
ncbi:MAG TPA: ferredoxin [Rugosimonospora sp.]|nr:ferredoxin [Rugosimonospora sp.]